EIRVDAFPDKVFGGQIKSIDARVSQDSRSVLIRAELPNKDKRLLPGMFANVAVLAGAAQDVVTVPRTSVTYSLYGDSLFVASPAPPKAEEGSAPAASAQSGAAQAATADAQDFVVERRFVRTGEARGDRIAVLDGVKLGETVVSEGQIKLLPGAHVHIDRSAGLQPRAVLPRE
ncbi:MAG: efflux RND transporter periplasmic adaptor subunit, partial [Pseudomonadota bacterium]|nr:efflux RND transporter periplasmic adaptor subunit [Pseudomonadota bacterium]